MDWFGLIPLTSTSRLLLIQHVPGLGTVQDEDVVFYNNGTWIVYFDGTAHGLTSNNLDIDAFDIP